MMRLKNDLYTVVSRDAHALTGIFHINLNPSCYIYRAHFPGEPVTPGVCIVQMAKELLEELVGQPLEIVRVKNVKFLSVVSPETDTDLTFNVKKTEVSELAGEVSTQTEVMAGGVAKAKLSFVCRPSQIHGQA